MAIIQNNQSNWEVYAEVSKEVSQEFDGEVNEYAVVVNASKIPCQEQNSEVHVCRVNKSSENKISVEPDSLHIYSVVNKNRTYSTSSGSVVSSSY